MQNSSDIFQVVKELAAGGFATFLVAILIAGKYRVWVWGYILDEMTAHFADVIRQKDELIEYERREKNEWRTLAWGARKLTEQSVTLATKAVGAPPSP